MDASFKGEGTAFKGEETAFKGEGTAFKGEGTAFKGEETAFKGEGGVTAFKKEGGGTAFRGEGAGSAFRGEDTGAVCFCCAVVSSRIPVSSDCIVGPCVGLVFLLERLLAAVGFALAALARVARRGLVSAMAGCWEGESGRWFRAGLHITSTAGHIELDSWITDRAMLRECIRCSDARCASRHHLITRLQAHLGLDERAERLLVLRHSLPSFRRNSFIFARPLPGASVVTAD